MSESTPNPLNELAPGPSFEIGGLGAGSKKTAAPMETTAASVKTAALSAAAGSGGSGGHESRQGDTTPGHRQRQSKRASMSMEQMVATTQVPDTSFSVESSSTELSALKIQDAVAGRFRAYRLRTHAIPWYVLFHKTWYRLLMILVTCLHVGLIVFEPASSINMKRNAMVREHVMKTRLHRLNTSDLVHTQYLPSAIFGPDAMESVKDAMLVLEALFLLVHWWDVYVQLRMSGGKLAHAFTHIWFRIKLAVISVMSLNAIVSLILVFHFIERPFNFARLLRPILLVERLHNVRKLLISVIQSFKEIRYVLAGLLFMNFFSAVVATALFRSITGRGPGAPRDMPASNVSTCIFLGSSPAETPDSTFCSTFSKNCTAYWKTIWHSFMHLFTLLTTANYPDVMMPVIECEPAYFLFFAAFIFLGLFFLLNLVLAIVTNSFHVLAEKRIEKYNRYKSYLLSDAFSRIVMTLTNEVFTGSASGARSKNKGVGAQSPPTFSSFSNRSNASLAEFSSDVGWANSRIAMREAKAIAGGTAAATALRDDGLDVGKPKCCDNRFGNCFRLFCATSAHLQELHGDPDADIFDSRWDGHTQYERGDVVMTTARSAAAYRISQIVSADTYGHGETAREARSEGGAVIIGVRDTKKGPELTALEPPCFRTTTQDTLRIFVCGRSTRGEHPIVEQRQDFAREKRARNKKKRTQYPPSPWQELRLTGEAWHIFTQRHYPKLNQQYILGHFNYLYDTRCVTHLGSHNSYHESTEQKKTLRPSSVLGKDFVCNVALQKDSSVAFGDFVLVLLPLLDAKRVDQVCGFNCESVSTIVTKKVPWLADARKRLVVFFEHKCAIYFFDALVVLNSFFLITEFHLEDAHGTNWTSCNEGSISLCWVQNVILFVFVIELYLKITGYGFLRYWRSALNQIDFFAINMSLIFLILNSGPLCSSEVRGHTCVDGTLTRTSPNNMTSTVKANGTSSLSSFVTIFRLIRILRLLRVLRSVRVELRVVSKLAPLFSRFFGVLFFFYYVFAVVGMEIFAGTMHYKIPAVADSSYGLAQYYMNRFDNVYLTFMTLFELMVVNNWNIIMEGYVAATETEWSRAYFIAWFLVIVVVVMNVCAGFIIDAYTMLKPKMSDEVRALDDILNETQRVINIHDLRSASSATPKSMRNNERQTMTERIVSVMSSTAVCGIESTNLSNLNFSDLIARLDSAYLLSSRSIISTLEKNHIIFDQKLQHQLKIMVHIHEHSYEHLRSVFGATSDDPQNDDDVFVSSEQYDDVDSGGKTEELGQTLVRTRTGSF